MNSAYGNSPLRSELTRHSARPPAGGIYSVGITQNKKTAFDRKLSFYFGRRPDGAVIAPFDVSWHKLARGDYLRCFSACPDAAARIQGGADAPCLSGQIKFYQENGRVLVVTELTGLPKNSKTGFFAMHIHEGASCSGEGFSETQGHYDPGEKDHPNHAGDLPLLMSYDGKAYLAVRTDRFCVKDIIGKTVVIHNNPDDFRSQPSGNSGTKIACGVICGKQDSVHL